MRQPQVRGRIGAVTMSSSVARELLRPDSDSGLDLSLALVVDVHVHRRSDP